MSCTWFQLVFNRIICVYILAYEPISGCTNVFLQRCVPFHRGPIYNTKLYSMQMKKVVLRIWWSSIVILMQLSHWEHFIRLAVRIVKWEACNEFFSFWQQLPRPLPLWKKKTPNWSVVARRRLWVERTVGPVAGRRTATDWATGPNSRELIKTKLIINHLHSWQLQ